MRAATNRTTMENRKALTPGYGVVAKSFHWLIVALLVAQYGVAWAMPHIHRGTQPVGLVNAHLSLGVVVLAIVMLRLSWRMRHPVPLLNDNVPVWLRRVALLTHWLLYLLLFALPIMGWANASARDWRPLLFGSISMPRILSTGSALGRELGDIHTLTAYVLLGLIGLHVAAALYHHFWLRDRALTRMLSGND
jgi:cytochrome b561